MTRNLVTLVGEQPLPTLLSIRHLDAKEVLFVGTREWHSVSQHLQDLMKRERHIHLTEVRDPYDPPVILQQMRNKLHKLGWPPETITYDLSGGNKMMAFAAYQLAMESRSALVDVEFVRHQHRLRRYRLDGNHAIREEDTLLPDLITIADYLKAHAPGFEVDGFSRDHQGRIDAGGEFESTIYRTLEPHVDEILSGVRPGSVAHQIEIDLMIRCGNGVGLVEAKTGVNKAGIDQLDTAGNPDYLGRYAAKFLVTGRYLPRPHKALASAQGIHVVELPGYTVHHGIPDQEQRRLIQTVRTVLVGQ
jgi:hypothetical protein